MTDTTNDPTGDRPAFPPSVARIVREEAALARVDARAFWRARPMSPALRRARHTLWLRISIEAGWSASRIGRSFGVSHRAVLYGLDQAAKRHGLVRRGDRYAIPREGFELCADQADRPIARGDRKCA